MNQPSLFGPPDAYGNVGPAPGKRDTSNEAAEALASGVSQLRQAVLDAIREHGPLTVHECAERLGMAVWTVQPRFSELATAGAIEDSGDRRRNAATGRSAIVWRLV